MTLESRYPKLFENIEDKDIELRHLINVDENYEDFDSEEYEFDFEEFNYVVYLSELILKSLGEEKMMALIEELKGVDAFENFLPSEIDLYALKSNLTLEEIEELIMSRVESVV